MGIMTNHNAAADLLAELWARIGDQQWDRLAELLDPGLAVYYVHTGEVLDLAGFVRGNADYPGRWLVDVEDLLGDGSRAVARARVYNEDQTFYVASFATEAGGRITELTEVWTDTGQEPHPVRIS
jgi:DNA topoisomerase IB